MVGNVAVGGDAPISVQSMTNTLTTDVKATLKQIEQLQDNGAEFVWWIANVNPFTYGVELVRWASLGQIYIPGFIVTLVCTIIFLFLATLGYDPQKGMSKKGGGGKPS